MASYYVYSGATGTGDGSSWANAYTTLATAVTSKLAGDIFYVAQDHVEGAAAALNITFPGTFATPNQILTVNRGGSVPPVAADLMQMTTGKINTTGTSHTITFSGSFYMYGAIISVDGTGGILSGGTLGSFQIYDDCVMSPNGGTIGSNNGNTYTEFRNCTFKPGSASSRIGVGGTFRWFSGSVDVSIASPGAIFNNGFLDALISGVDFSAATLANPIQSGASTNSQPGLLKFIDCKFPSGAALATTPTGPGADIQDIRSDSAATNYMLSRITALGSHVQETSIIRSGGASISFNVTTSANPVWYLPFSSLPIHINNSAVGASKTVTLYGTWNSASVPNNDDIWIEVEYLGSSVAPLASFANNTKANLLSANAALPSDTSTWGGGGSGAGWSPFKMAVTFTPNMAGYFFVRIKAAKASSTFYVDPNPVVT